MLRRPSRRLLACLTLLSSLACGAEVAAELERERPLRIFAAASLTDALGDVANLWHAAGHPRPVLVLGGSASLARQIEAGAPADIFASADVAWMGRLAATGRIDPASRTDLLGNSLVLIAPRHSRLSVEWRRGFKFAAAFDGKLCTGEPDAVPVGAYAREALQHFGFWDGLAGRIVGTDDARAALAFVERGECGAGIVYATDAAVSKRVEIVARVPADSHRPIVYPFAQVIVAGPQARAFLEYLRNSREAAATFERRGFVYRPAGR